MRVPTMSAGHQVGGELQPGEVAADGAGQRLGGQGLGQAGRALEQAVAPGQQADEEPLGHAVLADDDLLHLEQGPLEHLGLRASWRMIVGVSLMRNSIGSVAGKFLGAG